MVHKAYKTYKKPSIEVRLLLPVRCAHHLPPGGRLSVGSFRARREATRERQRKQKS